MEVEGVLNPGERIWVRWLLIWLVNESKRPVPYRVVRKRLFAELILTEDGEEKVCPK